MYPAQQSHASDFHVPEDVYEPVNRPASYNSIRSFQTYGPENRPDSYNSVRSFQRPSSQSSNRPSSKTSNRSHKQPRSQSRESSRNSTRTNSSQQRPRTNDSIKSSNEDKRVAMTETERDGIASEVVDPLVQALKKVKNLLMQKHEEAMRYDKVVEMKMCLQALKRLDKGEREIKALEDEYVDAFAENRIQDADKVRIEMVDIKAAAIQGSHLELLGIDEEVEVRGLRKYHERKSPPVGRRGYRNDSPSPPPRKRSPPRSRSESRYENNRGPSRSNRERRDYNPDRKSQKDVPEWLRYNEIQDEFYHRGNMQKMEMNIMVPLLTVDKIIL